jgi:hypothetical protein
MPVEHGPQSAFDQIDVRLGSLDPRLRFLLEGVQHMNAVSDPHGVNGAIGVAAMVIDKLVDT